jgi:hypothetical protein
MSATLDDVRTVRLQPAPVPEPQFPAAWALRERHKRSVRPAGRAGRCREWT